MPCIDANPAPAGFDLATVDRLLSTTRAVRKRLDLQRPVPLEVVGECLRLAMQAPTGTNAQTWRWIVVTDPAVKAGLSELYRQTPPGAKPMVATSQQAEIPDSPQQRRVGESSEYLRQRLHEVPVLVVPCILDAGGAAGWAPSIYPAVWSFVLALRSRGLGSVLTTTHLFRAAEAADLLGIPEGYVQTCLLPVAYYTGDDFKPAVRKPLEEVAFLDHWGTPLV